MEKRIPAVDDIYDESVVLAHLSSAYSKLKLWSKAEELAARIPVDVDRVKTFCGISEAQNQSGNRKDAIRLALKAQAYAQTTEVEERPSALLSVLETLEALGAKSKLPRVFDAAAELSKQHLEYSNTALSRLQEKCIRWKSKTRSKVGAAHRAEHPGLKTRAAKPFFAPD